MNLRNTKPFALAGLAAVGLGYFGIVLAAGQADVYRIAASSYLDGSLHRDKDDEAPRDVAFDRSGNLYVVGGTQAADFPVTEGAYDTSFNEGWFTHAPFGEMDVFVTKVGRDGKIVWSTYLGGPEYDRAYAVEVDAQGYVYVAGRAGDDFPTTEGAVQTDFAGDDGTSGRAYGEQDGFVSKLSPDGGTLIWSTYFGASGGGFIRDLDIDAQGNVYIGLSSVSGVISHITPDAAQPERRGVADAVYAKLSPDGRTVLYATYYGGTDKNGKDGVNPSIRVNALGEVYMLAATDADDIPITAGAFQARRAGGRDLTLAKYSASGALVLSTYLGGREKDDVETHGLALDHEGRPIVAAVTRSPDFPMPRGKAPPPFANEIRGPIDGIIAMLSTDGTRLIAATYLGGSGIDGIEGVAVGPGGDIVVAGATKSNDFPVTDAALQTQLRGTIDIFVAKLSADLSRMIYATYLGGGANEGGRSVAVSAGGEIATVAPTRSRDFPVVNAFDGKLDGRQAATYVRLSPRTE